MRNIFRRTTNHGFLVLKNNGPLDEGRVLDHDPNQLIIAQVFSFVVLFPHFLICPNDLHWRHAKRSQQVLKFFFCKRFFGVIPDGEFLARIFHQFESLSGFAAPRIVVDGDQN